MCGCFKDINDKLAERGQRLPEAFTIRAGAMDVVAIIPLIRKDTGRYENRRKVPGYITLNFCPWCGEEREKDAPAASSVADEYRGGVDHG